MGQTASVDVGTTATLIIPANTRRASYFVFNNGAATIFVGENTSITTGSGANAGLPIFAFSQISEDRGENLYKGDIFGIVVAGTEEMRFWERLHSG